MPLSTCRLGGYTFPTPTMEKMILLSIMRDIHTGWSV